MPLLLFTLDKIDQYLEEEVHKTGFRGALAKGEGIFALSQAVEELLQGRTFFLTALATMAPCGLTGTQSKASEDGTRPNSQSASEEQTNGELSRLFLDVEPWKSPEAAVRRQRTVE